MPEWLEALCCMKPRDKDEGSEHWSNAMQMRWPPPSSSRRVSRFVRLLLVLLACGSALNSQAPQHTPATREQTNFGAEGDFEEPVSLPPNALQSLRSSHNPDDLIRMCAQESGITVDQVPASWFVASEIRLTTTPSSGRVVRGEHACLRGAHIAQFWILEKSNTGYRIVFRGRADGLTVLPTRSDGYRDVRLVIVPQAGAYVDRVNFRYRKGQYLTTGHHLEHSNP